MEYRRIGTTDLKVSEIGLGCWTLGGLNYVDGHANGWANVDEGEIRAAVERSLVEGVNHFDNADVYGNGNAERMLARVLKSLGAPSDSLVISSKVGHFRGTAEHAYDPFHIRRQCEQSLRNLDRDHIDIYYLHHGDFGPEDRWLEGAAVTMAALKDEGKIRAIGQSAYRSADFERAVPVVKPDVLQSWAHAMDTKFVEPSGIVGQLLERNELSFVAFSPLNQGLLLDKYHPKNPPQFEEGDHRKGKPKFSQDALERLAPKLEALKERFGSSTEALSSVALRYVLSYPRVASVIPGFRNEQQVACNLSASGRQLSEEDGRFVRELFA